MNYTDEQLKKTLAKMLPNEITYYSVMTFYWNRQFIAGIFQRVLDTELLHLCWMVEETLNEYKSAQYSDELIKQCSADAKNTAQPNNWSEAHATWQQRVTALAKVKGVEIKDKE